VISRRFSGMEEVRTFLSQVGSGLARAVSTDLR
jgi:hypothetical protein